LIREVLHGIGLGVVHLGALCAFIPDVQLERRRRDGRAVLHHRRMGITLGFHRTLTHRSLRVNRFSSRSSRHRVLALQGADRMDRHASRASCNTIAKAIRTTFTAARGGVRRVLYRRNDARLSKRTAAPGADLAGSKFYMFLENTYLLWQIALGLVLSPSAAVVADLGVFVRCVVTITSRGCQQRRAHDGYQTFRTGDNRQ